jgi:predicted DNA-binding WGR domain protein
MVRSVGTKVRRFELVSGTSSKFWEIGQDGKTQTVTFGRIGSAGASKAKTFPTPQAATEATDKLIGEKVRKGYVERGQSKKETTVSEAKPTPKPSKGKVVAGNAVAGNAVSAFFRERAGLVLPDHVFAFWKFWTGLATGDRAAIKNALGLEAVFSLFELFDAKRPADPRSFAWNEDFPPELFAFLSGGDGPIIYGLWFDDPSAGDPIVVRYVRGGTFVVAGRTLFDALDDAYARAVDRASRSWEDDPDELDRAKRAIAKAASVRGPKTKPSPLEKDRMTIKGRIPLLSGVGVVSPDAKTVAAARRPRLTTLQDELRSPKTKQRAIAKALESCAAGKPGEALALGHDLIWCGAHRDALPLLKAAFTALGREALADVAAARTKLAR